MGTTCFLWGRMSHQVEAVVLHSCRSDLLWSRIFKLLWYMAGPPFPKNIFEAAHCSAILPTSLKTLSALIKEIHAGSLVSEFSPLISGENSIPH